MANESLRIAMIGCGNLGSAIVQRWMASGTLQPDQIVACTATEASATRVRAQLGVAVSQNLAEALRGTDVAILAFKPQQRQAILPQLAAVGVRPLWISLLAGAQFGELTAALGPRVIRWMPNTPVAVGAGVTAQCAGPEVSGADHATATALATALGTVVEVTEANYDAFAAVAGCGPAYVYAFCEALAAAGVAQGLDPALAAQIARQTVVGAGQLLGQSAESAAALREKVTSKGGMTAAALATLGTAGWEGLLADAVAAAVARARGL